MQTDLKDLVARLPGLDPDKILTDPEKALIALLAHHERTNPIQWLRRYVLHGLRQGINAHFPDESPDAQPTFRNLRQKQSELSEGEGNRPEREWTDGEIENCLHYLSDPARKALIAFQAAPPAPGMHQLWTGTIEVTRGWRDEGKKEWEVRLARQGPYRHYLSPTSGQLQALQRIGRDAPNLAAVTDYLLSQLRLARRSTLGLRTAPRLLLVGPPAAGKTWWAEQVAAALGQTCHVISLANVTASFELSGGSTQWYSARPGRIVQAFMSTPSASPVIVLDEIDKALTRNGYPTADALLDLIERSSATRWHDEFYNRTFDVSTAIVIATANDPDRIDAPLRSRFQSFDVKAPRPDQMLAMVRSVWRHYRQMRHDLVLPKVLDDEVVARIAHSAEDARAVMRLLDSALAHAAERGGRIKVGVADLRPRRPESVYLPGPDDGAARH